MSKLAKLRKDQSNLPVRGFSEEIVRAVYGSPVVVIAGDTGCGKVGVHVCMYVCTDGGRTKKVLSTF